MRLLIDSPLFKIVKYSLAEKPQINELVVVKEILSQASRAYFSTSSRVCGFIRLI
jgi:hypothetical protein